jgi:hypothetical protein
MSNIYQVFGYKSGVDGIVRSLRHHRWPFDIRQEVVFSSLAKDKATFATGADTAGSPLEELQKTGTTSALMTFYIGCWMSDFSISYASDTALVQETCTVNVTDIIAGTSIAATAKILTNYDNLSGTNVSKQLK